MFPFPLYLILDYLDLHDATELRTVCRDMCAGVAAHLWTDPSRVNQIEPWRACFPRATTLYYAGRSKVFFPQRLRVLTVVGSKLFSRSFKRLKRLTDVCLRNCRGVSRVLPCLSKLKTLDLSFSTFDGQALRHLTALESLVIQGCRGVSNADLARLKSLSYLDISETSHLDTALLELPRLRSLCVNAAPDAVQVVAWLVLDTLCACNVYADANWALPHGLKSVCLANTPGPDARLRALVGVEAADLSGTTYDVLTPLDGVRELTLCRASLSGLRDLRGCLKFLDISYAVAHPSSTFGHLSYIGLLRAHGCDWLDADVFEYVKGVYHLEMKCLLQDADVVRDFCVRLNVNVVYTCTCSAAKFRFFEGPVVWVEPC